MNGTRIAAKRRTGRYKVRRQAASVENRWAMRLLVCALVFGLILLCKTRFPTEVEAFAQGISRFVGRNADFTEAFASVGRAVSGEDDVGQSLLDAFRAVFGPSEIRTEKTGEHVDDLMLSDPEAQAVNLSAVVGSTSEKVTENAEEFLDLSGGYAMQSLPENASLEQRNLGFPCTSPINGVLTSAFGWREHPTQGGTKFHYGVDLAAETGCEIVAFADGEVFAVGQSSTLGKYIILVHAGGYRTLYAHCSEILVRNGSVVMGEVIACVGESGSVTGAHLHFELQDGALYLNPIYYIALG